MAETFTYSYDTLMTFSYGSAIARAGFVGFSTAATASGFWAGGAVLWPFMWMWNF
ncbi:MAG: hypothetical protein LBV69_11115 [Bacteroidales bacterium]|jgi:hypothetical protein|nr:hypothetical protein [Bacteroidales bacterium]